MNRLYVIILALTIFVLSAAALSHNWLNNKLRYKFAESFQTYTRDVSSDYAPLIEDYLLTILKTEIKKDPINWAHNFEPYSKHLFKFHARITNNKGNVLAYFGLKYNESDKYRKSDSYKKVIEGTENLSGGPYYLDIVRLDSDEISKIISDMTSENYAPLSSFNKFIENSYKYIMWSGAVFVIIILLMLVFLGSISNAYESAVEQFTRQLADKDFTTLRRLDFNTNFINRIFIGSILREMSGRYNNIVLPILRELGFTHVLQKEIVTDYVAITCHEIIRYGNARAAQLLEQDRHDTKHKYYDQNIQIKSALKGKTEQLINILTAWPEPNTNVIKLIEDWVIKYQERYHVGNDSELVVDAKNQYPEEYYATCCREYFDLIMRKLVQNTNSSYIVNKGEFGKIYLKIKLVKSAKKKLNRLFIIFADQAGGADDNVIRMLYKERLLRDENSFTEGIGAYLAGWLVRLQSWSISARNVHYRNGDVGLVTKITIEGDYNEL